MRIPFAISRETYLAVQPPLRTQWPKSRGSVWATMVAVLCGGVGLVLLVHHIAGADGAAAASLSDYAVAILLILASGLVLAGMSYLPKIQARRIQREHRELLSERYDNLHCRNNRYLETSDEGFVFGCDCKRTSYSWPQLVSLIESGDVFIARTKDNVEVVPKPAFPNEAAITEFRQLLTSHMDRPDALKARAVQVSCTPADLRWARWLHIRKGGGWKALLAKLGLAIAFAFYLAYLAEFVDSTIRRDRLLYAEAAALGLLLLMLLLRSRPQYLGPFRVWFNEDAIHVEYPFSLIRVEWYRMLGFLEDKHNLLLCHDERSYLTLPQRFIDTAQGEFVRSTIRAKLRRT
jgi:hypothetical protein